MICKLLSIIIILFASAVAATAQFKDNWQDKSPHKSAFVNTNCVKLHYLDWGGKGETLLFLPAKAKVVVMSNTDHWFFIQNQAEVMREMRTFLLN